MLNKNKTQMEHLASKLRMMTGICLGDKATDCDVNEANSFHHENGKALFPDDFCNLLRCVNGIRADNAQLYAFSPQGGFADAVLENERLDRSDAETVVVIGKTDFDYLVFDWQKKQYQLRDRLSDKLTSSYGSIEAVVLGLFM